MTGATDARTALVVDSDATIRLCCARYLEGCGYQVTDAADGAAARAALEGRVPDLVVLDSALPDQNGFEICQAASVAGAEKRPRIVMTSARCGISAREKAMALGADVFLEKPFGLEGLARHAIGNPDG